MYIYLQYCYNQNQYQAVDELGAIYQKYKYTYITFVLPSKKGAIKLIIDNYTSIRDNPNYSFDICNYRSIMYQN